MFFSRALMVVKYHAPPKSLTKKVFIMPYVFSTPADSFSPSNHENMYMY